MKGITYCGACADYDIKKHRCKRGATQESNPQDKFFDDCPLPTVAPVVHGRWIGAPLCGNDNCRCSECGSWHNIHANLRGELTQKYCPNCGAKMDGGNGNG